MNPLDALRAVRDSSLCPTERLVLMALVLRCDATGKCFPSASTLSKDTGYSYRSVQRALTTLEADETCPIEVKHTRRTRQGRLGYASNLYTLRLRPSQPTLSPYDTVSQGDNDPTVSPYVRVSYGVTSGCRKGLRHSVAISAHSDLPNSNCPSSSSQASDDEKREGHPGKKNEPHSGQTDPEAEATSSDTDTEFQPWRCPEQSPGGKEGTWSVPADWTPDARSQALAQSLGLDLDEQVAAYREHNDANPPDKTPRNCDRWFQGFLSRAKGHADRRSLYVQPRGCWQVGERQPAVGTDWMATTIDAKALVADVQIENCNVDDEKAKAAKAAAAKAAYDAIGIRRAG